MTVETWELLALLLGVMFGGGGIREVWVRWRATRSGQPLVEAKALSEAQKAQAEFYEMWSKEIGRLQTEVSRLQVLVGALESEILSLGGDPERIKMRLRAMPDAAGG